MTAMHSERIPTGSVLWKRHSPTLHAIPANGCGWGRPYPPPEVVPTPSPPLPKPCWRRTIQRFKNETPKKARGDRRRNGASIAKFRTRRPAHICETSRYRAVFKRPSFVTRWRRTGWLGRQDSNLCISDRNSPRLPARARGFEPLHLFRVDPLETWFESTQTAGCRPISRSCAGRIVLNTLPLSDIYRLAPALVSNS